MVIDPGVIRVVVSTRLEQLLFILLGRFLENLRVFWLTDLFLLHYNGLILNLSEDEVISPH